MSRKLKIVLWASVICLGLFASIRIVCAVRRETQINFTTYQCIRLGDTEDEIEQLIGLPSGSYSGLLTHWGTAWPLLPLDNFSRNGVLHENGIITKGWASKDG